MAEAAAGGNSLSKTLFNQISPGKDGKLARNLMLTTALSGIGAAATIATAGVTGGLYLPFAMASAAPGTGFAGAALHGVGQYFAMAVNGGFATIQTGYSAVAAVDWSTVGSAVANGATEAATGATNGLTPAAA